MPVITPNRRPPGIATFFNPIDMALLSAVKAGIFVVQAAGNTGPSPMSMSSFSPWIFTIGATSHDRAYSNSLLLGNNLTILGVGLAPGTDENTLYKLIHAKHALNNDETTVADDMYVGECLDASKLDQDLVQGNLLICSYSIRFVLGLSSIKQALETAKNLSAVGVIFPMDPFVTGFQLNPIPMKIPAPGNFIWAAWSSLATDSAEFLGENFAMMSGTSMAAPHVAGLAALVKQKFPNFSPAAIGSVLSTTASLYDNNGKPIMSQRSYASPDLNQSPATPFDMGSGFVNATAALIRDCFLILVSYDDYMSFLCAINGSAPVLLNYTGQNCWMYNSTVYGSDLNLPSITIANLNQSRVVQRTVQNIAGNETYSVGWSSPYGFQ
ncbi:Peptidase S8/S53 domain [Sesbania bispinosa]|nr:Peptidase S8/S53 domain [Sesbania bispinosa]